MNTPALLHLFSLRARFGEVFCEGTVVAGGVHFVSSGPLFLQNPLKLQMLVCIKPNVEVLRCNHLQASFCVELLWDNLVPTNSGIHLLLGEMRWKSVPGVGRTTPVQQHLFACSARSMTR